MKMLIKTMNDYLIVNTTRLLTRAGLFDYNKDQ